MNTSNCVLSIVLLLLYVKFNLATDVNCNNVTHTLLKNLGEYTVKIDELELTMNSLQSKLETFLKESDELLNKAHGHELSIKQQEVDYKEVLRKHSLIKDQFETTVKQQELTIATLKAERDKLKLNVQKQMNRTEPPSCIAYGNDIQRIRVPGADAFQAPCHTTFEPIKGWTVIQRRFNGSVSFDRKWDEYKNGFGDLRGEYWLGLEKLHLMTKFQPHELYIELENHEGEISIESWSNFSIGNESESYKILSLGANTEDADFTIYYERDIFATNIKFSTKDRDNDNASYNCADVYESGWWYKNDHCVGCNLNGIVQRFLLTWYPLCRRLLKSVQMMIRPIKK